MIREKGQFYLYFLLLNLLICAVQHLLSIVYREFQVCCVWVILIRIFENLIEEQRISSQSLFGGFRRPYQLIAQLSPKASSWVQGRLTCKGSNKKCSNVRP